MNITQFTSQDTVAVYGRQLTAIQAMVDYDYVCGKSETSIRAIIDPSLKAQQGNEMFFFGGKEVSIPTFPTLEAAATYHPATVLVNFASARSVYLVTNEALESTAYEKIAVIAEGMPERETRLLKVKAEQVGKYLIGPATVGGLVAQVIKIGNAGGTIQNVVANYLYERGNVGIVSKSGGMLNELMTLTNRVTNGVCEAIAIGGDRFPFTTLSEQVQRFEENPDISLILLLGEVGGTQELEIARLVQEKSITKPIVAWVSGVGNRALKASIQFGHAGAMANTEQERAEYKLQVLREAGVVVPESYAELESVLGACAALHNLGPRTHHAEPPALPEDFQTSHRKGALRYPKQLVSSITPHKDGDATYGGIPIHEAAANHSIGSVMGLLWFKKEFPENIQNFFELTIRLVADHGPLVSGAHNTIVAARAGKDLVSSLVSGLLTIGPRFGGAVNESAKRFKKAADTGMAPFDFIAQMKAEGTPIPGIGHRVKSTTNPDTRVQLLLAEASKLTEQHTYLEYAQAVEKITTRKKNSLILNVDGAMAAIFLDILSEYCTSEEVDALIEMEAFNAFFVLGRSIGLIGHFIDQRRLGQPLYRHPDWDLLELP